MQFIKHKVEIIDVGVVLNLAINHALNSRHLIKIGQKNQPVCLTI